VASEALDGLTTPRKYLQGVSVGMMRTRSHPEDLTNLTYRHQGTDTGKAIFWNCETSSRGCHCRRGNDNGYVTPM